MNEMTELEKAYLAGFFDGEGCISITAGMDKKKGRTPNYQMTVVITQKSLETIKRLYEIAGIGKIYDGTQSRSRSCSWRLTHIQARQFLVALLPYLQNKKGEAELAIEFVNKFNRSTRRESYFGPTPQHIVDEKERYRLTLHDLKGISGSSRGRPRTENSAHSV